MAYQTRGRDPLLDSNMQAAIEKRGKELIGICLILLGLAAAAMIGSYTPDDPNWIVSTDAPVQNWMGRIGASIAAPLFMIVGWGSWAIALTLLVWGARFAFHQGEERAVGRLIFAPIAIAVCSIYASTLVPGEEWRATHSFGLGGLFGDTVMGAMLTLLPIGSHFAIKLMSLVMAAGMIVLGVFVLGFTRPELQRVFRFLMVGVIMGYGALVTLLGRGASGGMTAAREYRTKRLERAELARQQAAVVEAEPEPELFEEPDFEPEEPTAERGGFLKRMPTLIRRPEPLPETLPEPELVEQAPVAHELDAAPGDDRIRAKIADAVRQRKQATIVPEPDPNLPLTKGRGRGPDPLVLNTSAPVGAALPPEPPLTAAPYDLPPEPPVVAPVQDSVQDRPLDVAPAPEMAEYADPYAVETVSPMQYTEVQIDRFEPEVFVPDQGPDLGVEPSVYDSQPEPVVDPLPLQQAAPVAPKIPAAQPRKAVVEQPTRKAPAPSRRAKAEAQPALAFEDKQAEFELPPLNLLTNPMSIQRHHLSDEALEENARMLEHVLDDYGVKGEIVSVRPGPVVTMYELEPAPGLKASRVIGLADDIARSMSALSARVSTVPGRSVIGIELPNENREKVVLREILASRDFGDSNMSLPLALGKDIGGDSVVANLAKMPHLLIAGTTGSGKSVAINTMILSLLYKLTPEQCRLIMIDPKMLELSVYDGIPHLLSPVVTDPKKAVVALKWVVGEMEDRYRKMSKMGVRNIEGFNGRVKEALAKGEMFSRTVQTGFDDDTGEPVFETEEFAPKALPYIVVIVDEMADLMMVAGKEIEACIQRLAQMARASGIHLIMATQRPSVDVITGTIKANFPTRISFQVTSKVDSRTILGEMGAEQLLGMGDMLYMAGGAKITRCHGPFCSDEEVEEVVNHLKQFGPPDYVGGVVEGPDDDKADNIDAVLGLNTGGNTDGEDALYDTAVQIVIKDRKCSTSYIQRKLAIGYNKAARLVEQMEEEGLVSPANHVGKREILVPEQQ
ncbi:MAG: DNA translocase FtsK [Rhodobacteraceae bacterium]|nr:DNA translocase FtsK [Paracoccaceae bacterium]